MRSSANPFSLCKNSTTASTSGDFHLGGSMFLCTSGSKNNSRASANRQSSGGGYFFWSIATPELKILSNVNHILGIST